FALRSGRSCPATKLAGRRNKQHALDRRRQARRQSCGGTERQETLVDDPQLVRVGAARWVQGEERLRPERSLAPRGLDQRWVDPGKAQGERDLLDGEFLVERVLRRGLPLTPDGSGDQVDGDAVAVQPGLSAHTPGVSTIARRWR